MTRPKAEVEARKSAYELNLAELRAARDALADAIEALKLTMQGPRPTARETYVVALGFAYGRLRRIIERDHGEFPA
jgi:hypothetical protein